MISGLRQPLQDRGGRQGRGLGPESSGPKPDRLEAFGHGGGDLFFGPTAFRTDDRQTR